MELTSRKRNITNQGEEAIEVAEAATEEHLKASKTSVASLRLTKCLTDNIRTQEHPRLPTLNR